MYQLLVIAFVCYFSIADCHQIVGLEGKWRLSRAERSGLLVSTPMWKGYTLEITAVTEDDATKPVAKSYRRAKTAVFIKRRNDRYLYNSRVGAATYNNGPLVPTEAPATAPPVKPIEPTPTETPVTPAQAPRVSYYKFTFLVKNKITATLKLREDGKWVIIEGEHTLSIPYGEDYRAEIFIEKVLEGFKYMVVKNQKSLYMMGYGRRMIKFSKVTQNE